MSGVKLYSKEYNKKNFILKREKINCIQKKLEDQDTFEDPLKHNIIYIALINITLYVIKQTKFKETGCGKREKLI